MAHKDPMTDKELIRETKKSMLFNLGVCILCISLAVYEAEHTFLILLFSIVMLAYVSYVSYQDLKKIK